MASLYFKKTKVVGGTYWKLYSVRNIEPKERSKLSILVQEYQIISGDISMSSSHQEKSLKKLRDEMQKDSHIIILKK